MTTINNSENLIEKVGGIEKAREIVEDAPEGKSFISGKIMPAEGFDVKHGKYVMCDGFYKFHWCNGWDIYSYAWHDFVLNVIDLNDLRTAIAEHDREFKIGDHIRYMGIDRKSPHPEIFEVVGFDSMPVGGNGYKIKNRLGQIDFCYGDNYALVDCDTTDHVTDIRNHIFPSTKVIDHG